MIATTHQTNTLLAALAGAVLLLNGCEQQHRQSWYDESKYLDGQRQDRVNTFVAQGMAVTSAERAADFESAVRNTERGPGVPPLEGDDLKRALHQTQ